MALYKKQEFLWILSYIHQYILLEMIHSSDQWFQSYDLHLFCFALSAKWLFWKTTWFLGLEKIFNVTYKMNAFPKHCYAWQLICCHDVIDTNQNFYFLGIGKKPPPVFLWIEVALLNKYLNRKMEINNLFINSEILSTFKLAGNSTIKKTIFSRMWRKFAFWLFFSFYLSLVL